MEADLVSREQLCELVWSMPMTKVAAKFSVSLLPVSVSSNSVSGAGRCKEIRHRACRKAIAHDDYGESSGLIHGLAALRIALLNRKGHSSRTGCLMGLLLALAVSG